MNAYFWVMYIIIVLSAIAALEVRSLLWAGISFVVFLSEMALLYLGLGAPLIGGIQLAMYAGGVTVLMLFAVMMLGEGEKEKYRFPWPIVISTTLLIFLTITSILSAIDTFPFRHYTAKAIGIEFARYSLFLIPIAFIATALLYLINAVAHQWEER